MISWAAAWGIRWVKPSIATVSPSRTASFIASARDEIRAIWKLLPGCGPVFTARQGQGQMAKLSKVGAPTNAMLGTAPIFTIHADLEAMMNLGRTPYGERRVIGISDGAADIQARYTIETDSGALILVTSDGLRHGPPAVMERLARGDSVDPALYYFRTVMRFETADPAVDWINRILALARGQREARVVRLDVYEVE